MTTASVPSDDFAPTLKAVYLMSVHTQYIHCDDQRLIISGKNSGAQPLPFSRIERIVSGPNTRWSGQAIAHCLLRDIPIIWLDQRNQPVGDAHPLYREGGPVHHDVLHFLDLSDSMERYANWLKSQRMDSVNRTRKSGISGWLDGTRLKRAYVYNNAPETRPDAAIRAACQSVVNRRLATLHVRTRYWGINGCPMELAGDLADLVAMEFHLVHPNPPRTQREQVEQFEAWWKDGCHPLDYILNHFIQYIRNEIESCP